MKAKVIAEKPSKHRVLRSFTWERAVYSRVNQLMLTDKQAAEINAACGEEGSPVLEKITKPPAEPAVPPLVVSPTGNEPASPVVATVPPPPESPAEPANAEIAATE